MDKSDWKEFAKLMSVAAKTTAGKEHDNETLVFMFEALKRYEFQQIRDAVMYLIQNSQFTPKIADIITHIAGSVTDKARRAWDIIISSISTHGTYRSISFGDPRLHYALYRVGGWQSVGEMSHDRAGFVLKEFSAAYAEADREGISWGHPQVLPHFAGHTEHAIRGGSGQGEIPPPVQVDCGRLNVPKPARLEVPQISAPKREVPKLVLKSIDEVIG